MPLNSPVLPPTPGAIATWRNVWKQASRWRTGVSSPIPAGPSIGLLGGFYPYAVLSPQNELAQAALDSFIASERQVGNMYDTGNSVCAWYRLWKCMACLYAGRRETAENELELLLSETGSWGELFEIYEKSMRPFFATAEGIFLSLLHQLYKP